MSKGKDYTGQKFGRLTFLSKTDQKIGKEYVWELICECGNSVRATPRNITSGGTVSCGCYNREKGKLNLIDYTGQKFGKLTFVKDTGRRSLGRAIIWELLCDCGTQHYSVASDVVGGKTKSCGCHGRLMSSITAMRKRKYTPEESSARSVWAHYKESGLDFETFFELSKQPCHYCKRQPFLTYNRGFRTDSSTSALQKSAEGNFTYNGLDRVDSTKGHTIDNVVPCCAPCNKAKGDMTYDEFIDHIERMYDGTREVRESRKLKAAS